MDGIIRMATELGVCRVVPLLTAADGRSRSSPRAGPRRLARWQRVAREAAKQSGRAVVPEIAAPRGARRVAGARAAAGLARLPLGGRAKRPRRAPARGRRRARDRGRGPGGRPQPRTRCAGFEPRAPRRRARPAHPADRDRRPGGGGAAAVALRRSGRARVTSAIRRRARPPCPGLRPGGAGVCAAVFDPAAIEEREVREVRAHGADARGAASSHWINECLYVHEVEGFAWRRIEFAVFDVTPRGPAASRCASTPSFTGRRSIRRGTGSGTVVRRPSVPRSPPGRSEGGFRDAARARRLVSPKLRQGPCGRACLFNHVLTRLRLSDDRHIRKRNTVTCIVSCSLWHLACLYGAGHGTPSRLSRKPVSIDGHRSPFRGDGQADALPRRGRYRDSVPGRGRHPDSRERRPRGGHATSRRRSGPSASGCGPSST